MSSFASGKHAFGECDRCGWRVKYTQMQDDVVRGRPTDLKVCPECKDVDHPQNWIGQIKVGDPQGLKDARPVQNQNQQLTPSQVDWTYFWR